MLHIDIYFDKNMYCYKIIYPYQIIVKNLYRYFLCRCIDDIIDI